ncbi:MAG: L-threonylcarbamoyladenylate synthase [bacterium]|jgi:L-threonylcarbamoyladenylate synthase|nr:L-threonylcarbamoyladenylate synthase [bacterium]
MMILNARPESIQRAADCVKRDGLIAYPTETIYGLGVDPTRPAALDRLFSAKGRSAKKAVIVLIRDSSDLHDLTLQIPESAHALMTAFWPGPLTLIFKANPNLPGELLGGGDTIALRHSNSPVADALLKALGGPLTSTSANISGQPPATSAQEVYRQLAPFLDLIIDGGPSTRSLPSTLVDLTSGPPTLLRVGAISREDLLPYFQ